MPKKLVFCKFKTLNKIVLYITYLHVNCFSTYFPRFIYDDRCIHSLPSPLLSSFYLYFSRNCFSSRAAPAAAKSLQSCPTLCDPIDGSHQAPPSLGFSRQEHWSGLPFPSPTHPEHLVAKSSGRTLHAWLHLSFFKLAFLTLSSLSNFSFMYFLLIQLMNDTAIHSVMFKKKRNSQVVQ